MHSLTWHVPEGKAGAGQPVKHAQEAATAADGAHNVTATQKAAVPASKTRAERQAAKKRPTPEVSNHCTLCWHPCCLFACLARSWPVTTCYVTATSVVPIFDGALCPAATSQSYAYIVRSRMQAPSHFCSAGCRASEQEQKSQRPYGAYCEAGGIRLSTCAHQELVSKCGHGPDGQHQFSKLPQQALQKLQKLLLHADKLQMVCRWQLIVIAFLQVGAASVPQRPAKQAGTRPKRPSKQADGLNKHSVERKRQADTALDQLAARSAPSTSGTCSVTFPPLANLSWSQGTTPV